MPRIAKKKIIPTETEQVKNEPAWIDPPEKSWRFDFGKFAFGLFLVVMGLLYLAKNTGWLPINFQFEFWELWPMLLIFFGLSFISGKGWTGIIAGSIFTMTVLIIAGVFISDKLTLRLEPELTNIPIIKGHLPSVTLKQDFPVNIDRLATTASSNITIKHKLGNINIAGGSTKLATGGLATNYAKLLTNTQAGPANQSIELETVAQGSRAGQSFGQLDLQLDSNLPINLNLETGSADTNLNLNKLMIKNLSLNSHGSDINLSLSNQAKDQNLNFQGPISTLTINLPLDTAIKFSSPAISATKIENFKSINADVVISKNYNNSSSTINIELDIEPEKLIINWLQ